MRLYHGQGLLEAATGLVIEYLDAVLGKGGEYFGLETSLQANNRPAWVPWTVIDRLCLELSDNAGIPVFAKCLDRSVSFSNLHVSLYASLCLYLSLSLSGSVFLYGCLSVYINLERYIALIYLSDVSIRLDRSVESYLGTVERVSRDMIANRAQE